MKTEIKVSSRVVDTTVDTPMDENGDIHEIDGTQRVYTIIVNGLLVTNYFKCKGKYGRQSIINAVKSLLRTTYMNHKLDSCRKKTVVAEIDKLNNLCANYQSNRRRKTKAEWSVIFRSANYTERIERLVRHIEQNLKVVPVTDADIEASNRQAERIWRKWKREAGA